MPAVNCTACRWHCTKYPDIDLCPQAFAEGRFPPGTAAKDFVRIDGASAAAGAAAGGWSEQEEVLLLEALELHGEDWTKIAAHVGTKSPVDCVLRFMQLPIEEDIVADLEAAGPEVRSLLFVCLAINLRAAACHGEFAGCRRGGVGSRVPALRSA
jgi:SWI/SNF related-matrix-associated actin-dependent regulator of chromatin subfamily C